MHTRMHTHVYRCTHLTVWIVVHGMQPGIRTETSREVLAHLKAMGAVEKNQSSVRLLAASTAGCMLLAYAPHHGHSRPYEELGHSIQSLSKAKPESLPCNVQIPSGPSSPAQAQHQEPPAPSPSAMQRQPPAAQPPQIPYSLHARMAATIAAARNGFPVGLPRPSVTPAERRARFSLIHALRRRHGTGPLTLPDCLPDNYVVKQQMMAYKAWRTTEVGWDAVINVVCMMHVARTRHHLIAMHVLVVCCGSMAVAKHNIALNAHVRSASLLIIMQMRFDRDFAAVAEETGSKELGCVSAFLGFCVMKHPSLSPDKVCTTMQAC